MSGESFDDLDRALASGLSSLAPDVAGDDALTELRPRFERARTRRRVAFAGSALAVAGVVGAMAAVAAPGRARSHVRVAVPPSSSTTSAPASTTSHRATSTTAAPPTVTTPTTVATAASAGPTTPPPSPVSALPTTAAPAVIIGTTPTTLPATTTTTPGEVRTYRSGGGSVVVRVWNGELTLLDVSAAAGYSASIRDDGPSRIEVRFENGNDVSRIVLRVSSGHVVQSNSVHR
jgi:hypothetical protein